MKNLIKILAFSLVLIILLTACGTAKSKNTSSNTSSSSGEKSSENTDENNNEGETEDEVDEDYTYDPQSVEGGVKYTTEEVAKVSYNTDPTKVYPSSNDVLKTYVGGKAISKKEFMPSVAYIEEGVVKDILFDSFAFLPSPTWVYQGGSESNGMTPMGKDDWLSYINKMEFKANKNMDALDEASGDVINGLGLKNYKTTVFFTLLYPVRTVSDFGEVNGKHLDLSKNEDRIAALKWMVDEQIKVYKSKGYKYLKLGGFFWFPEEVPSQQYMQEDAEMLRAVTDYVRSLKLQTVWSPYYRARGAAKWKDFGFDKCSMQFNYFPAQPDAPNAGGIDRIASGSAFCLANGMGVEMELGSSTDESCTGFKEYMKGGVTNGYMNDYCFYYFCTGPSTVWDVFTSESSYIKSTYDELYRFVKGALTLSDININSEALSR